MPVLAVRGTDFVEQAREWIGDGRQPRSAAIILDTYDPQKAGGTGTPFRWEWVTAARDAGQLANWPPIFLAGGLRPENVVDAIRAVRPYGVDVSSGVEGSGAASRKDAAMMKEFVQNARRAFSES